jgi:hypothetical protein
MALEPGAHVIFDDLAKVTEGIAALAGTRVMVGVPSEKGMRSDPESPEPINNAALAYIHEHGAPEANIPARPFLVPGLEADKAAIESGLTKVGEAALDGRADAVDRGFHAVGLRGQAAVRKKITDGPFQPLAPSTLAARRRRGRTGDKPLIDTAQLRSSLSYVIRKASDA